MSHLSFFESGDYAAVLAYVREYEVIEDFFWTDGDYVQPEVAALTLVRGEHVERLGICDQNWWYGRLVGTDEKGLFPAQNVRKRWNPPTTNNSARFSAFPHLSNYIRDRIYAEYFGLFGGECLRMLWPGEMNGLLRSFDVRGHGSYLDISGNRRFSYPLRRRLFEIHPWITKDVEHWLACTCVVRMQTYRPLDPPPTTDDIREPVYYPPLPARNFFPVVRRLEIEILYLDGIPRLIAEYGNFGPRLESLSIRFRYLTAETKNDGYYRTFGRVVEALEPLRTIAVRNQVDIFWCIMHDTFAAYPPRDVETYCSGYERPVEQLKADMVNNWQRLYNPWYGLPVNQGSGRDRP